MSNRKCKARFANEMATESYLKQPDKVIDNLSSKYDLSQREDNSEELKLSNNPNILTSEKVKKILKLENYNPEIVIQLISDEILKIGLNNDCHEKLYLIKGRLNKYGKEIIDTQNPDLITLFAIYFDEYLSNLQIKTLENIVLNSKVANKDVLLAKLASNISRVNKYTVAYTLLSSGSEMIGYFIKNVKDADIYISRANAIIQEEQKQEK